MRCQACDILLADWETRIKCKGTGEYPGLCSKCLRTIKDSIDVPELETSDPEEIDGVYFQIGDIESGD